jgi:hypothetical protein
MLPFKNTFEIFRRVFSGIICAALLVCTSPAQAKIAFYLIEDTEDPNPSLAACMAVYTNGVLLQPEKHIWILNYEVWEVFYEEKMLFCHKHGVIFPKGERVD